MSGWGPYLREQEAKRNLCEALRKAGATIFGWYPNRSDPMFDYHHPASWDGIATYKDYTIVVAVSESSLSQSGKDGWPTFQPTKKGYSWHIEKHGIVEILGKGLNQCSSDTHERKAQSYAEVMQNLEIATDALAAKILRIIDGLTQSGQEPMLGQPQVALSGMEPQIGGKGQTATTELVITTYHFAGSWHFYARFNGGGFDSFPYDRGYYRTREAAEDAAVEHLRRAGYEQTPH